MSDLIRLDKFLCEMGIGTRSKVKKLIKANYVTVNNTSAVKAETKIDTSKDVVLVNGKRISYVKYEYYILNKPAGCVSATEDNMHKTVMDYITDSARKDLFPVGRLDFDTEGLLLITNDGELSHKLLSPSKHVKKTYYARIAGKVTDEDIKAFKNGLDIGEDKPTKPGELEIITSDDISEILLTITEGKFHQVKRMFTAVGKEVIYLKRVAFGNLILPDDLEIGEYRELTDDEISNLKQR